MKLYSIGGFTKKIGITEQTLRIWDKSDKFKPPCICRWYSVLFSRTKAADLPPGGRRLVTINGLSIGVFNVHGAYYALLNRCAHQGGPLCLGDIKGLAVADVPGEAAWIREGEILRCPWHRWEFDIKTGIAVTDPAKVRVKAYEVTVEPDVSEPDPPRVPAYTVTVESGWLVVHV